jgi:hypothetical protein
MASAAGREAGEEAVVDGHSFVSIGRPRPALKMEHALGAVQK